MTDTPSQTVRPLPEFGAEHHLVLNLTAFVALSLAHEPRVDVALRELAARLPGLSLPSLRAERLVEAARALVAADAGRYRHDRAFDWAVAQGNAARVLGDLFFWRAGLAQEAVRAAEGDDAG